jgi:hypothetical protein
MSANNDPIGKSLNLTPMVPSANPVQQIMSDALSDSAKSDFEIARTNLHTAINAGIDALSTLGPIAESSQHPRAFEVVAKLIDSIATASKDLMELQKSIREIEGADKPVNGPSGHNVTNNLFVGSTAELQKILNDLKNGK